VALVEPTVTSERSSCSFSGGTEEKRKMSSFRRPDRRNVTSYCWIKARPVTSRIGSMRRGSANLTLRR